MKKEYLDVLKLTRACLTGEKFEPDGKIKWERVCDLLRKAKLYPVVYRTIFQEKEALEVPERVLAEWKDYTFSVGFRQLVTINELQRTLQEAEARGIELISFKGVTLATLYPEAYMRVSSDVDLLVSEEQRNAAEQLLVELGYEKVEKLSKAHVPTYMVNKENRYLVIELHDRLWEDYEGKQANILKEMRLDNPCSLIKQEACGLTITTLGHTEHLIYQIFHMAKHLFFEGICLRYLVDIMLFIEAYTDVIDFEKARKEITKLHYEKLYDAILKICYEYLGMKVIVPDSNVEQEVVNEPLLVDIIECSKMDSSVKRWETINFLSQYFMRTSVTKTSDFQQKRKQLLPLPSELNDKYKYAKKCPILLPIAWIHRIIYMINYSQHCVRNNIKTSDSIEKAQYRLNLMRQLEITETDKDIQDLLGKKNDNY